MKCVANHLFLRTEQLLCSITIREAPLRLEQTDPELISPQHTVMEGGLSLFCQAFDEVIDCRKHQRGRAGIQIV